MSERIFNTLSVDGDDSKLDASLIANMNNNAEFSALRHDASTSHIIQTATGNPAYFDDGADNIPIRSVTIAITAAQEGSGEPSSENIRPISGWDGISVYHSDVDTEDPTEYTFSFSDAGTVYGGTFDAISGALTVTHGYIESYSGEELPGVWISDRDVYAEGTTPTEGAQVVYELVVYDYYALSGVEIKTNAGVNNVWSNAGSATCEYCVDFNSYVADRKSYYNGQLLTLAQAIEAVKRRNNTAAGYSSSNKALATDFTIIPMGMDYFVGSNFTRVSDGGYRVNKAGTVSVSAGCFFNGFNAGDVIIVCIGKYNAEWQYVSTSHFPSIIGTSGSCDIVSHLIGVSAGDIIYLRARNATAARGVATSARLFIEYI